jgi:hypothetical protein
MMMMIINCFFPQLCSQGKNPFDSSIIDETAAAAVVAAVDAAAAAWAAIDNLNNRPRHTPRHHQARKQANHQQKEPEPKNQIHADPIGKKCSGRQRAWMW